MADLPMQSAMAAAEMAMAEVGKAESIARLAKRAASASVYVSAPRRRARSMVKR
jgi:hypothetical protein